jgi:two-component system nitrogen regulation response regulator GlnG
MSRSTPPSTRSKEVFLIDDDDDLRFTIGLSLRDADLEVREFASADDALPAVIEAPPGTILLDYRIEGMSAEDFVVRLREADRGDVPVILLTGTHNIADLARQMGAFDWLGKPFEIDDLVGRARRAIAHGR